MYKCKLTVSYLLLLSINLCFHINGELSNLHEEFPLNEELGLIFSSLEVCIGPIHI